MHMKRKNAFRKLQTAIERQHDLMDAEEIRGDPMIIYGYGVVAFFSLVKTLILTLTAITVFIALP
jgi:hypothetical protein